MFQHPNIKCFDNCESLPTYEYESPITSTQLWKHNYMKREMNNYEEKSAGFNLQ